MIKKNYQIEINAQFIHTREQIHQEYDLLVKGITDQRDKLLKELQDAFDLRVNLLEKQFKLLTTHLTKNEECETQCLKYKTDAIKAQEIPKLVSQCIKQSPEIYTIPYDIGLQQLAIQKKEKNFSYLFSKLKLTTIAKEDKKNFTRLKWENDEGLNDNDEKWRKKLSANDKIDAFDRDTKQWYTATIIDRGIFDNKDRIQIKFDGFGDKFNMWFDINTHNIALFHTHTGETAKAKLLHLMDDDLAGLRMSTDEMDDDFW